MKLLKKMLLINWHYFSHELIQFERLNFLTGQNAAGKSTLIDAMQIVLLGETKSYFFNKAANERSERTIGGYLRGELGDDGGVGFKFLRNGDFSSYLIMEFYDDRKKASFMTGVIFDVYSDGTQKDNFFVVDDVIPEAHFVENGIPMSRDALRKHFKQHYGKKVNWCDTKTSYQNVLLGKLGNIKRSKFFNLIKKAVPFTPITDIETFITEYVTDVKNNIDISYMQDNLRNYKRLEKDAVMIQERIGSLDEIGRQYETVQRTHDLLKMHRYLSKAGYCEVEQMQLAHAEEQAGKLAEELKKREQLLKEAESGIKAVSEERDRLKTELATADIKQRFDGLEKEIMEKENQRALALKAVREAVERIRAYAGQVLHCFEGREASEEWAVSLKELRHWSEISLQGAAAYAEIDYSGINSQVNSLVQSAQQERFELGQQAKILSEILHALRQTLAKLRQGEKSYSAPVIRLKNAIDEAFGSGKALVLADVLKVRDPRWKNVIEGYLHTQKFNLLVPGELFENALSVYEKLRDTEKLHGVGLVDVQKIAAQKTVVLPGSLAEEVTSDNPDAQVYVNYLLGKVIKCESAKELRQQPIGITDKGMLYKNYVAVQMDPQRWAVPFIGRQALQKQIEQTESQEKQKTGELKTIEQQLTLATSLAGVQTWSDHEVAQLVGQLNQTEQAAALSKLVETLTKERDSLDLGYLHALEAKIIEVELSLEKLQLRQLEDTKLIGIEIQKLNTLNEEEIPRRRNVVGKLIAECEAEYEPRFIQEIGLPNYEKERLRKSAQEIYQNFGRSAEGKKTELENARVKLQDLRSDYNRSYHMSHDVRALDNSGFDGALLELRELKLPDYLVKIQGAREQASVQFRDEFLAKLKENFDTVRAQIAELNTAIKTSSFGNDRYRFEAKPKPEHRHFYEMIMDPLLLTEGLNIMSYAFTEKHGAAIEELFNMIVEVGESGSADHREKLEKNIRYFTDYRSYLNFDLVVTDQEGREQRLSRTLLKKSGGETQTPFYIAVLASFAQMYRIAQHEPLNNTARLILFDEAFSKMDSQRIRESLELLNRFGLQALVAAPPDKISDITPYVDQNLCVFRQNDQSFVKAFTKKEMLEA